MLGAAGADALFAEDGNDIVFGGDGNDLIEGGSGADILTGDSGDDNVYGDTGNDALFGGQGNDLLAGGDGNDRLQGDAGIDTLDGGTGVDDMTGGSGDDTYVVDNEADRIAEFADEGVDTVRSSLDVSGLSANLENITLTDATNPANPGSDADSSHPRVARLATGNDRDNLIMGNHAANTLTGGSGNDTLDGGRGADLLVGGTGDDQYVVDEAGDAVIEAENQGLDTVMASVSHALVANLENLVLTGAVMINATGNEQDNTLNGNLADNVIDGRAGLDTMSGGKGSDTYVVDHVGDRVIERSNEGIDTVQSSISFTLSDNVENLALSGSANLSGTGNALANILRGNAGDNWLDGAAGADTMIGASGNDRYAVRDTADLVIEMQAEGVDTVEASVNIALYANVENLILTGDAVQGSGNALDNTLTANDRGNTLAGADGNDTLTGGLGRDVLDGGAGNDVLNGGNGADQMRGGAGDDTYIVDDALDAAIETLYGGIDTVKAGISLTLSDQIERMVLMNGAIWGKGNALDNFISASDFGNALSGADGNDTVQGGAGRDVLNGGGGNDLLTDINGGNVLVGAAGNDRITTGVGNNLIIGGRGADMINTGAGRNIIAFNRGDGADTVVAASGAKNTLSFGKGIDYKDIRLQKSGNDLLLDLGSGDSIKFKDWYIGSMKHTTTTLQFYKENSHDYNPCSSDSTLNKKVTIFDFVKLVESASRAAQVANHSLPLSAWSGPHALQNAFISSSDTKAFGGDLAQQYARMGSLDGDLFGSVQATLSNAQFGVSAQSMQRPATVTANGDFRILG